MKRLKSAFFLLLCFALGIGLALALQHLHRAPKTDAGGSVIGKGNAPPWHGFSLPAGARPESLDRIPSLHATAVAVVYGGDAAALERFVYHAHKLNLQVVLLPPDKASAEDPFDKPLATVAAEAQRAGVDGLCASWLNVDPDPDYWQPQLAEVRKAFHGQLILAASPELLPGIEFWDKVDLIGAIGPFDLPLRSGTNAHGIGLTDLRTAWACYIDSLESLAFRYGKRVVLLKATVLPPHATVTEDFPALVIEALATETKGRLGTEGVFLPWEPTGAPGDTAFVNHNPDLAAHIASLWLPSTQPATAPAPTTDPDDDMDETDPTP